MRVTEKFLQARVDRLNKMLNRPATAWTRIENAQSGQPNMRGNVGHFMLDKWAPGDGWTRYKLAVMLSTGGGENNVSQNCTAQEMSAYLQGVFDVLDSLDYTKQFVAYPKVAEVLPVELSSESFERGPLPKRIVGKPIRTKRA